MSKNALNARFKSSIFAIAVIAAVCSAEAAGAASLVDVLTGTWSGRGQVAFEGGSREDLTCRAFYSNSGSALSIAIRCASTSYKTEIRSKLQLSGNSLSGEWEERNFNAAGSASGSLSGNTILLRIRGAIDGSMTINQVGGRQTVTISTNQGGLSSVRIGLSKS